MNAYRHQTFSTPEGTTMVVLPAAEFERLLDLADEASDVAAGQAALQRLADGEGTMPGEVLGYILDGEMTPLGAWRKYRGLTQAEVARRAGLSQVWVGRIEAGGGYGSQKTRRALAKALDAPLWTLEEDDATNA